MISPAETLSRSPVGSSAKIKLGSVAIAITSSPITNDYDVDDDGTIGAGDLSLLATCWLCTDVAPCWTANACDGMDFDCDGLVGLGDLVWFSTGWQKGVDDPTLEYPPCP